MRVPHNNLEKGRDVSECREAPTPTAFSFTARRVALFQGGVRRLGMCGLLWQMNLPPLTGAFISPRLLECDGVEPVKKVAGRLRAIVRILGEARHHERVKIRLNRNLGSR